MTRPPAPFAKRKGPETLFPPLSKGRYRGVSRGIPAEAVNPNPLQPPFANHHVTLDTVIPANAGIHRATCDRLTIAN